MQHKAQTDIRVCIDSSSHTECLTVHTIQSMCAHRHTLHPTHVASAAYSLGVNKMY